MVKLEFKPGTEVRLLDTVILPGLLTLAHYMETILGVSKITVTSANDGTHKPGSLHYQGRALDIRSNIYPNDQVEAVVAAFRAFYPDGSYQLLWEAVDKPWEHLHLEYDPENENH